MQASDRFSRQRWTEGTDLTCSYFEILNDTKSLRKQLYTLIKFSPI